MFNVLLWLQVNDFPTWENEKERLFCVEFFEGIGSIKNHWRSVRLPAAGFDRHNDKIGQDWNGAQGLVLVLQWLRRVPMTGIATFAPCCSSFVWLARGTSKRCRRNPEGDLNNCAVLAANRMLSRLVLVRF